MDNLQEIQSHEQPTVQRQLARLRELEAKKQAMYSELEFSMLLRGLCGQDIFDYGPVRVRVKSHKVSDKTGRPARPSKVIVTDGNRQIHEIDFDDIPPEQQSRLINRRAK